MSCPDLTPAQFDDLSTLLSTFQDMFVFDDRPVSQTTFVKYRIDFGDASTLHRQPYRYSAAQRRILRKEVKMLHKDITETSPYPWAPPVVQAKKTDDAWRFCIDYHHLNNIAK